MIRYDEDKGVISGLTETVDLKVVKTLKQMPCFRDGKGRWVFVQCHRVTKIKGDAARELIEINERQKKNGGGLWLESVSHNVRDYWNDELSELFYKPF